MKKQQTVLYKSAIGFALIVIFLSGCKDNLSDAGLNLLPKSDLVQVAQVVEKSSIRAHTELDVNQRTDKPEYNLLGTYNDSIFGKTTADFACQFRINKFPDFSDNAQPDSIVLYLYYKAISGDTVTPQHFKVYEINSDLGNNMTKYYQNVDLKGMTSGTPLADFVYTPKFKLDSLTSATLKASDPKDTVLQKMAIKLDNSFAQKLISADSTTFSSNDDFLQFFKGLYIEAQDVNQGGALMYIPLTGKSTIYGSSLVLHYHNATSDSLYYSMNVNSTSVRVNHFSHDYSTTRFSAQLQNPQSPDSLIFIQSTGGLRAKVNIPNLGNISKLIPGIGSDSTRVIINGAELVFQVDTTITNVKFNYPPSQLIFSAIARSTAGADSLYLPSDYSFSPAYYNGYYNSSDKTYRFNIVKHLQEVVDKVSDKENLGFYLSASFTNSTYGASAYRRVVLKGPSSKTGIKLNITYSITN